MLTICRCNWFRPLSVIVNGLAGRQNIATDRFRTFSVFYYCMSAIYEKNNLHLSAAFEMLRMRMVPVIQYLMLSLSKHENIEA